MRFILIMALLIYMITHVTEATLSDEEQHYREATSQSPSQTVTPPAISTPSSPPASETMNPTIVLPSSSPSGDFTDKFLCWFHSVWRLITCPFMLAFPGNDFTTPVEDTPTSNPSSLSTHMDIIIPARIIMDGLSSLPITQSALQKFKSIMENTIMDTFNLVDVIITGFNSILKFKSGLIVDFEGVKRVKCGMVNCVDEEDILARVELEIIEIA